MKKLNESQFPSNRYKHCHSVGKKMYQYAKDVLKLDDKTCGEMFVLGCIHDIGYEINSDAFGHDTSLYAALCGYKYRNEIKYHSSLQTEYDTPAMRLLYFGDMTVDGFGNWCTFDERLSDLATRHGKDSDVYIESFKIAEYLKSVGFNDEL